MSLFKPPAVKSIALAIVVLVLVPVVAMVIVAPRVLAEDETITDFDRSKLIMLAMIALVFSDIPLNQVERYELFNTLYVYRNGHVELINQPYIPGDKVLNITKIFVEVRENTNISYVTSESRVYVYINETLSYIIEYVETPLSWNLWIGELHNKTIDSNTVMY